MSRRICYLARADRGGRLTGLRLLVESAEEAWAPPHPASAPDALLANVRAAAAWLADRLADSDSPQALDLLCVDADGSVCTWLTAPSADASVIAAALEQTVSAAGSVDNPGGLWSAITETAGQANTIQSLMVPGAQPEPDAPVITRTRLARAPLRAGKPKAPSAGASDGDRMAVLAVPDTLVRLFIDALDDRALTVGTVVSLWHALAAAWDPASPAAQGGNEERVVATSSAVVGIILIDPVGRLIWSWSRESHLLAGGTIRLADARRAAADASPASPRVGPAEVGRLTADWLAWAAQLGQVPTRIVCLSPDAGADGTDRLTAAGLGEALGLAWPGATVDLAVDDDPIGATLRRLAGLSRRNLPAADRPAESLVELARRPGRTHRALYRWTAAAILVASAAVGALAWKLWRAADVADAEAGDLVAAWTASVQETYPLALTSPLPDLALESEITKRRQALGPPDGSSGPKPILNELDALSYVLSDPEIEIRTIDLRNELGSASITIPNTKKGEDINQALREFGGSHMDWTGNFLPTGAGRPNQANYNLVGTWRAAPAPVPPAPEGEGAR